MPRASTRLIAAHMAIENGTYIASWSLTRQPRGTASFWTAVCVSPARAIVGVIIATVEVYPTHTWYACVKGEVCI